MSNSSKISSKHGRTDQFVSVNERELHYSEWGEAKSSVVLCLHGFSRVGRDFDPLAKRLADEFRVICPDMPGRGLSEWSQNPKRDYTVSSYVDIVAGLCDVVDISPKTIIGTSMGGILTLQLAAHQISEEVTHIVLNDSGPAKLQKTEDGIERIISYLSDQPTFDTVMELKAYYQDIYDTFSPMTAAEWNRFTITSARRTDDGKLTPNYDPRAVEPYFSARDQYELWDEWNTIDANALVLRGEHSDILTKELLNRMIEEKPSCETIEVSGCGHVPSLNVGEQIEPIVSFLKN